MSTHQPRALEMPLTRAEATAAAARVSPAARAESLQRRGKAMIFAGFVLTIVGAVLYCGVCFAGGMNAELADILFENTVPFARAMLGITGLGTLVWLVGSFTYLRGAMDAEEEVGPSTTEQ
ncbi:MAG: hypothetical protein K8H88_06630 [Sandaracinaceae bacterium]|nr:hypothetical protein [Sandaracinaceae bacterium]